MRAKRIIAITLMLIFALSSVAMAAIPTHIVANNFAYKLYDLPGNTDLQQNLRDSIEEGKPYYQYENKTISLADLVTLANANPDASIDELIEKANDKREEIKGARNKVPGIHLYTY